MAVINVSSWRAALVTRIVIPAISSGDSGSPMVRASFRFGRRWPIIDVAPLGVLFIDVPQYLVSSVGHRHPEANL
jgi:hypothetical protein